MNFDELLRRTPSSCPKNGERDTPTAEAMQMARMTKIDGLYNERGFTLIELLIALALTAIIGGALYQGLVNQSRNFSQQDQTAEAQQNCRVGMDNILRETRMAGYSMAYADAAGNPFNDRGIVVGSVTTINQTVLQVNNDPNRNNADALMLRRGDSIPFTIWIYIPWLPLTRRLIVFDERCPVFGGDYVLLMNPDRTQYRTMRVRERTWMATYGTRWTATLEDYTGSIASSNGTSTWSYGGGTVVKLKESAFYIDSSSGSPVLMKAVNGASSQVVARNIEDLQVAYQDSSGNWYYHQGGTGNPIPNNIRNARINLVGRSRLPGSQNLYFQGALEDGTRHPLTGADGYVRRALTTQVRVRNFGVD
jgi:prepilin-type N-terminal cleavage/methylation domain-containing protein